MDRLLREGNPPTGQLASPKPQYKKPGVDEYEPVEGQHGAPFAILKDANGNVISPATDAKLEQVKSELELIKSELQTIKANQLSGDQKVQLSGKMVEEIVLFNQMEIRDTAIHNSVVIPSTVLSKIRDFDIFITDTNTHGNTVKPAMSLSFHPNTPDQDTSFLSYSPDNKNTLYSWRVAPIDVAARLTLVTEIPELNGSWFSTASVTPYRNMSVWYLLGMANIRFYNRITEVVDDELNDKTKFLNTIKSSVLNAGIDLRMQIRYLTAPTMGSITAKFRGIV